MIKRLFSVLSFAAVVTVAVVPPAESALEPIEKFKFGTFELDGAPTLGLVLRDRFVVELGKANLALERRPMYPTITMPEDMKELAGRYHMELQPRVYQIVNHLVEANQLDVSVQRDSRRKPKIPN